MMLDARLYGIGTMKDGRHIPPHDLFANVDDPDNAPTKATAHMIEDEDDD